MSRGFNGSVVHFLLLWLCVGLALTLPRIHGEVAVAQASDWGWFMDRGDGARKGFADTYIPSQVEVMWERYQTSISLASVVSDGIYAYLTPQAGNVTAISVDGNRTLWEYGAGTVVATPLIVENFLVVGTAEGGLYFFERYTGYLHREVFIGHECIQHPLYWNNTIFIPGENWLTAVDPDGTILWSRHFEKEISAPPVGYLNNLYLLTGNQVWCLYKNSTLWKREFNVNFTSGIAASGNLVVTAESGQILALNAISGETKWERDMGCEAFSPAYCNGLLFTATRNGTLYALSTADGSELWNFSTEGVCFQSPVVNRYNILFASGCTLYCLKQNTGEILWTLDFETNLLTGISLVSSIIFTGDSGGVVYCISAPKPDLKVSVYPASPALYERTQVKISFSVFAGIMPAVNATVNLSIPAGTLSNYSGFTDADGIFAVVYTAPAVKDRENFTLKATFSYPGYRNTTRNLTVAVLPMPSVELNLSTEEETVYSGTAVEFTLTVLRDGKPVIGAPVYVWHGDMCIAEGYTDENGSFEFTHKMPEVQRETQFKIEARVYGTAGAPFLEKNASLRVVVVPLPQEGNKEPQVYGSLAVAAVLLLFFSGWNLWEWRKR